jgi:Uma2 family endonuclease
MFRAKRLHRYTYSDYVALELDSSTKHEFLDGEIYDTGEKVAHYRTIPSLRDYIVVSHRERRITVHARSEGGEWVTRTAAVGGRVTVESLRVELSVDDLYSRSTVR